MNRLDSLEPAPPQRRGAAHQGNGNGRGNGHAADGDRAVQTPNEPVKYLEVGSSGRRKYLVGLLFYLTFFGIVAGAVVWVFTYFTQSRTLALLLVGFMIGYMVLMGWLASRHIERSEQGPGERWH